VTLASGTKLGSSEIGAQLHAAGVFSLSPPRGERVGVRGA